MSILTFSDSLGKLSGVFTILVTNIITGKSWIHYTDNNTITLIAKRDVVRLLGNDALALRYISKMKFTAQGHQPLDITQAVPTTETWLTMGRPDLIPPVAPVYIMFGLNDNKAISNTTFTDNLVTNVSTVTFTTVVESAEPSIQPQIFSQAGLFTYDESLVDGGNPTSGLFAIKNFPVLVKTSDLRFTFNWSINV